MVNRSHFLLPKFPTGLSWLELVSVVAQLQQRFRHLVLMDIAKDHAIAKFDPKVVVFSGFELICECWDVA